MTSNFVHLHVHSEYSLLDGLARPSDLVSQAVKNNQSALALTDHGVMHGAIEFFRTCKKNDVKPIIGVEAYLTMYGRKKEDRDSTKDKARHHLLLLAQNMTGYKNLLKICSTAQLDGYYYKPRIDAEFLASHSDGLICTTGCMAAEVPYYLNDEDRPPNPDLALERLRWYLDVFGRDRFFVELQEHSIPTLTRINKTLFEWAKSHKLEMIVTNDVHYARAEDADPHDTLLCVQTSSTINSQKRMRLSDKGYYLKSEAEMRDIFRPLVDLPESAFTNTLKIAQMCDVDLEDKTYHLPDLPPEVMPPTHTYKTFLRELTEEGLINRYGERANSEEVQKRKEHELGIIGQMNFDVYFLIVWDMCEYARENNIWWNVRGSGAGSIVAYALGITLIDPLKNQLIFERFLNPGRVSMPDFDLDYPDDQREKMIEYTQEKYGEDHVAQIVSFGRMKARAAVRDVGRAQDVELSEVDRIAKLIPAIPGKPVTIDKTLDPESEFYSAELERRYKNETMVKNLINLARDLEGVARHASIHAAAVIVTDKPLVEYVPLMKPQGSVITKSVTQFEFPICESIGLLKVDFLGLSTLTIMRKAAELIKTRHGKNYDLNNIPRENAKAFELLASGNVTGIFQVESAGMRRILTSMKPNKFEQIIALLALYRPGPLQYIPNFIARMHGKEKVSYRHPALEPILEETYGIIVYQEQIMRIATDLAGYTASEADFMRKAVAKKKEKDLLEHKEKMIKGGLEKGIDKQVILDVFSDIEAFARYGFPKGHAADYAVITCQTAYLKAYYPVEYMTALLAVERNNTEKVGGLIEECRAMDIEVLPPNVNKSDHSFVIEESPDRQAIRFGLGAVKNVGDGPIEAIVVGREEAPFSDIDDFCQRVDLRKVGKRALESLIKAGALKDFGERAVLLALVERMTSFSAQIHRTASTGQLSMFDQGNFEAPPIGSILYPKPEVKEIPRRELLSWEKDLVGAYISSHPIQPHMEAIQKVTTCLCNGLDASFHDKTARVAGLITKIRQTTTKKGDDMAFVEIEDTQSSLEIIVFPRTYKAFRHLLEVDKIILVNGKVDAKDEDRPKILADTISDELRTSQPAQDEWQREMLPGTKFTSPATNGQTNGVASTPPEAPPEEDKWVTPPVSLPEEAVNNDLLQLQFNRSNDIERDKQKLQTLHKILIENKGSDYHIQLRVPVHKKLVRIDFPGLKIRYTAHLKQELTNLLGSGTIFD